MVKAVEDVRKRLLRVVAAFKSAGIPYAIAGGNAVASWVATIDKGAVRNTTDVDVLIRRADFDRVKSALASAGFVHRHVAGIDAFLDGPQGSFREAVHILFATEKVRPTDAWPNPDVVPAFDNGDFDVLELEPLVRVKLSVFRRKDQVHLLDMIEVGLIDASWPTRFPPDLANRLQLLLDTPEG